MHQTKLPESFREYFWDVDFDSLTLQESPQLILKRVLDRGKVDDLEWILKNYNQMDIKKIILKSRDISRKTATFWANVLGLNRQEVICLQMPYCPTPFGLSS